MAEPIMAAKTMICTGWAAASAGWENSKPDRAVAARSTSTSMIAATPPSSNCHARPARVSRSVNSARAISAI